MNDKVDTRVVRMEFDNKQFEKNIKQTNKSLENLKQNLDFKGVGEGLDKVRLKISALQIATTTFVATLTNKIINLGTTLVKSLSVDNISAGWSKFGEKTVSVATMMAQKIRIAGQEIEDYGQKTEIVNGLLEKLAWFADETSYSFSDMTNYVGKFIAAGQDLDKSVKAMEGIATWAAMSGQNSQTASRAMMQLAQAMGRSINRQDWSSIQTANMDTERFREKVLETAVALGELTKEGDKFVTKTGKKFDKSGFLTYFSEGWFTSDVLVETLNKYSAAVDEIYEISEREGITASEVIEKYGDSLNEFGKEAFLAAQEARTFNDVLNSVKDAVSSKWMTTFETFFGDKDESVKLWTELANSLYDVFAESGNFRNNMMSVWKEMGGRNDIFGEHGTANQGAFWNLYDAIIAVKDMITEAFYTIFPISEMEDENDKAKDIARSLKGITNTLNILTQNILKIVKESKVVKTVFEAFFKVIRAGLVVIQGIKYALEPIFYTLKQMASQVLYRVSNIVGGIDGLLAHIIDIAEMLNSSLWELMQIIDPSYVLDSAFNIIKNIFSIISNFSPIGRVINLIKTFAKGLKEGGGTQENFIRITQGLFALFNTLSKAILSIVGAIAKYLLPILDKIVNVVGYVAGFITGIVVNLLAMISDVIKTVSMFLDNAADGISVNESIKNFLEFIPQAIEKILPILQSLLSIVTSLIDVILLIPQALDAISRRLTGKGIVENLTELFNNIAGAIKDFVNGVDIKKASKTGSIYGLFEALMMFFEGLREILKALIASAQAILVVLSAALKAIGKVIQNIADVIIKVFSGNWKELTDAQRTMITTIIVIGAIVGILYMLWAVFYRILALVNPIGAVADSIVDAIDSLNLNKLTNKLTSLSKSLLRMAVSVYLLDRVDKELAQTALVLISVFGLVTIIGYFIVSILESVGTFGKKVSESMNSIQEATKNTKKANKLTNDLVKVLKLISKTMLLITAVALIFDRMQNPWQSFGIVMIIFGTLSLVAAGLAVAMGLMNKNMSKADSEAEVSKKNTKSLFKTLLGLSVLITSLGVAMVAIAGSIALLTNISKDSRGKVDVTALIAPTVVLSLMLGQMIAAMIVLSKTVGSMNLSKVLTTVLMMGAITTAIVTLASAIATIASFTPASMITAGLVLTLMFAGVVAAISLIAKQRANIKRTAQSVVKLGSMVGTIVTLAAAIAMIATLDPVNVAVSATALTSMLAALVGLSFVLSKIPVGVGKQVVGMVLGLSGAIALLASAVLMVGLGMSYISGAIDNVLGKENTLMNFMISLGQGFVKMMSTVLVGLVEIFGKIQSTLIKVIFDGIRLILDGLIQILTEYVAPLAAALVNALIEVLTIVAQAQTTILNILGVIVMDALTWLFDFLIANIPTILTKVVELVSTLIKAVLDNLPQILNDITDLVIGVIDIIAEVLPQIIFRLWEALINALGTIWNNIMEFFGIDEMQVTEEQIKEFMEGIKEFWVEVFKVLKEVGTILKPIIKAILELLQVIIPILNDILTPILGLVGKAILAILDAAKPIIEFLLGDIIVPIIEGIIVALTALTEVLSYIGPVLQTLFAFIEALFSGEWSTFADKMAALWTPLKDKWDSFWGSFWEENKEKLTNALRVIGGILTGGLSELIVLLVQNWDKIVAFFKPIFESIFNFFKSIWNKLVSFFKPAFDKVYNFIKKYIDTIKAGWTRIKNFFIKDIPEFIDNIGKGLKQGIERVFNKIKDSTIGKTVSNLIKYIKTLVGVHSPSTVFAEIGGYLMEGLGLGIVNGAEKEKQVITGVFKDLISTASDLLNADDDFTIKVGMDISEVELQTANIKSLMSGVSNYDTSVSSAYKDNSQKVAKDIEKSALSMSNSKSSTSEVYNDNTTNNNVFHITSNNPKAVADEVDKVLQQRAMDKKIARGGI